MGPFRGGNDMLAAVRDAPIGLPSLAIFRWQDGGLADEYGRDFDPSPNFIFMGDINGSGDSEAYMIRHVDPAVTGKPRLFMRQRGDDPAVLVEDTLDADNGYKVGASGDIDGDGRDEVVLIRNNAIREYLSPDRDATFSTNPLQSNQRTLVIGNLDAAGYLPEVVLQASPTFVRPTAHSGTPSTVIQLSISGSPSSPAVPINVTVVQRVPWLQLSANNFVSPAEVTLTFDASALAPGQYSADLLVTSASPLVLQPLTVPVSFRVTEGLLVRPTGMAFIFPGCPASGTLTLPLAIEARSGTTYTLSLLSAGAAEAEAAVSATADAVAADITWPSSVPWLSATSPSNSAPSVVTLKAEGNEAANAAQARAVISAKVGDDTLVRTVPISLLCAESQAWLPVVAR